jgi:hypothetical protein
MVTYTYKDVGFPDHWGPVPPWFQGHIDKSHMGPVQWVVLERSVDPVGSILLFVLLSCPRRDSVKHVICEKIRFHRLYRTDDH